MSIDLTDFRVRLKSELDGIDEAIAQAMARGVTERLVTRKRKLIAAIARVEAGSFGRCCECAVDIGTECLISDPAAVFCSDCLADRDIN